MTSLFKLRTLTNISSNTRDSIEQALRAEIIAIPVNLNPPRATADGHCPRCGGEGCAPRKRRKSNPFVTRLVISLVCDDCGLDFQFEASDAPRSWPW